MKDPKEWERVGDVEVDQLKARIRINLLQLDPWLQLARLYKKRMDFFRAEICYQGALYCGYQNKDVVHEWVGVFAMNRIDKDPKVIKDTANRVLEAVALDLNQQPAEQTCDHLLYTLRCLDDPKLATVSN